MITHDEFRAIRRQAINNRLHAYYMAGAYVCLLDVTTWVRYQERAIYGHSVKYGDFHD